MLQPRLFSRAASRRCNCLLSAVRSYATAVDLKPVNPVQATAATADAAPTRLPSPRKGGFQLKTYKPRTPGVRHLRRPINDHLWKGRPHAKLTFAKTGHGKGGRNSTGRITVRHRGGGHKRRIRTVDFSRMAPGRQTVDRVEYDPNRSAHIALLTHEKTKTKSYIVAAEGMRAGDTIQSYRAGIPGELLKSMGGVMDPGMLAAKTAFRGNCLPLHMVPLGTQVYNVGSTTGKGGVFCRSAGTFATVIAKDEAPNGKITDVIVRLQSGEVRKVSKDACATIGVASNPHHHFRQIGKAGRSRWLGIRPTVRGVAMNAGTRTTSASPRSTFSPHAANTCTADHPHGGGRGKSKGNVHPVSPWGQPVSLPSASQPMDIADAATRPKEVTRHGGSGTPTSMWCNSVSGTRARGEVARCREAVPFQTPADAAVCTHGNVYLAGNFRL